MQWIFIIIITVVRMYATKYVIKTSKLFQYILTYLLIEELKM